MDRIQAIGRGNMIFKERCCRVSYGVRCREKYEPDKNKAHVGQKVIRDPRDGILYVEDQIDWFIKQVSHQSAVNQWILLNKLQYAGGKHPYRWFLEAILAESQARRRR